MCDTPYGDGEHKNYPHGTGEPFAWRQGLGAYAHDRGSPDAYQPADGTDYMRPDFGEQCPATCVRGCYNRYPTGTEGFFRCLSQCKTADLKLQARSCGGIGCPRSPSYGSLVGGAEPPPLPPPLPLTPVWIFWVAGIAGLALLLYVLYSMRR